MTLEASFIVPMIICVFALLIYFSYYLYGRCILSQDAYILAFRASVADEEIYGSPESYVYESHRRLWAKSILAAPTLRLKQHRQEKKSGFMDIQRPGTQPWEGIF